MRFWRRMIRRYHSCMRSGFLGRNNESRWRFFLRPKDGFLRPILRVGRFEFAGLIHLRRRYRNLALFPDDRYLARIVIRRQTLAWHFDKFRLAFLDQRRAVLHTKAQYFFVVTSLTGRAIFHILVRSGTAGIWESLRSILARQHSRKIISKNRNGTAVQTVPVILG